MRGYMIAPCPSDLFQLQGVPLTPSQHRVQFRLPQWSSRPFDVLPSGAAVPGLPGTDRLRDHRPFWGVMSVGLACCFFRAGFQSDRSHGRDGDPGASRCVLGSLGVTTQSLRPQWG